GDLNSRNEAGEQDTALCLSACRSRVPYDRVQAATVNCHRKSVVAVREIELRAHRLERLRNSFHRTSAETRITLKRGREWTRRRYAGHQSHSRSTVPRVEG